MLVALARASARGDRGALERLVEDLYPVVRRWLGARLRHRPTADVDDLTQTAMALVAQRVRQCTARNDRQVRAWARAVAWRVALEDLRSPPARVVRRSQPLSDDGNRMAGARDIPAGLLALPAADALDEPDERGAALARAAVRALDRMPASVGLLFWMRLVEGASWPEVARELGTTTAGVKRRFERARAQLRRALCGAARDTA